MIDKPLLRQLLAKAHTAIAIVVILGLCFKFKELTWTVVDVAVIVVCGFTAIALFKKG